MKKTFRIAALALLASFALALAGCSNSSGGGAALATLGGTGSGGGNGTGGDNTGSGQSQQNTTETKWTISGTEYTVKDGKVTVTQNGTKTEVGTVDSSGVVTITQGGQTITVQAQGAGSSNVTVTIATTTTDSNGASTTTTKTYSGDITSGTLANTQDANDTITIAKVETTTGGGNANPPGTSFTVTYADGVDDAVVAVPTDATAYKTGDTVTVKFDGIGERDGYTFAGWSDGTTTYTSAGTKTFTMGSANVTLTARWTYAFHNTVKVLPAGTDGTHGTSAKYVFFGDFPQDILSKEKEARLTFDQDNAIQKGGLTYIPASDGNYYVYIQENAQWNDFNHPKYVDGSEVQHKSENSWRYFRVMPLKWRVLTNSYDVDGTSGTKTGALLVAENVINGCLFCDSTIRYASPIPDYFSTSRIRAYLNGLSFEKAIEYKEKELDEEYLSKGFLQTAFSQEAADSIITTHVDNSFAQYYQTPGEGFNRGARPDTDDKIFLLSSHEWMNTSYGFSSDPSDKANGTGEQYTRQRYPTDYAKACNAPIYSYSGWACRFFTRNPAYYYNGKNTAYYYVDVVSHDGQIISGEITSGYLGGYTSPDRSTGVVPALCVNLQ